MTNREHPAATTPAPLPEPMAEALRGALQRQELALVYQPQVCLQTGAIIGAEALLRWQSPHFGTVTAAEFLPLAERLGLMVPIGNWALQQACRQAAAWRAEGLPALRVGVNVSPSQLLMSDLCQTVRRALAAADLPPQLLGLEITEQGLAHDPTGVTNTLRALHGDGVEIALDDFGTGYSSLAKLRELPIDLLKVDRSFVHDVAAAAESASVTRSVIHLAHGLHLRVLAEGVETQEQLQQLLAHGCDRIQGHVFSAALSPEAISAMRRADRRLPAELTHAHTHTRTLLLVDDEEHILSALRRLFRRDGYRIITASSGDQALERLAAHPVDVIVSDQRMPGMTGVEFLHRAKALYPDTVRMTLSGYTDLQSIIDAVNEGAVYRFLTKPWDDERLRGHVAQAFAHRELSDENVRLTRAIGNANTELAQANRRLEHLAGRQRERADTLRVVAGHARDMVDAMPVAVFGVDPDGMLVYVNRSAVEHLPEWAGCIGDQAPGALGALVGELRSAWSAGPTDGQALALFGQRFKAWLSAMQVGNAPGGDMLILMPEPKCPP